MGRMRQLTYPDGEVLTYGYDEGGLLETASGAKQGRDYHYLIDLAYDHYDHYDQRVLLDHGTRYECMINIA